MEDRKIDVLSRHKVVGDEKRGFTLIELLVVISIIALLLSIGFPIFNKAKRQARAIVAAQNQKEIVIATTLFASDNNDRFPESVATVGFGNNWNWSDPTRLTGVTHRSPGFHRAMSEYLGSYIPDARTMYCPNAPQRYEYLQQAWEAGDDWDYPEDDSFSTDPVGGTYCFYWNYVGNLGEDRGVFRGPQGPASGGRRYSKLVVTDYFGYDHWRSPWSYGSCEQFEGAEISPETWYLSAYWFRESEPEETPEIELRAGYTDGHVETYSPEDTVPMWVSTTADGTTPYPDGLEASPGIFYLPIDALR